MGGLFAEADEKGLVDRQKSWWVQSEAAIGFFNAYQLTGDDYYLSLMMNIIDYIKDHIIDLEGGKFREWRMRGDLDLYSQDNLYPVNAWKGPYHNGRMCLELIERIEKMRK